MPALLYANYSRYYGTSTSTRKLWKIAVAYLDSPFLLTIHGRDGANAYYLVHYVIGKYNGEKSTIFNNTPSTLNIYRDNSTTNNIYLELNGNYSSAIVQLLSRDFALQQEEVTDSISTSSLQLIE